MQPAVEARVRQAMVQLQLRPDDVRRRMTRTNQGTAIALVGIGHGLRGWLDTGFVASVVAELVKYSQELHVDMMVAETPVFNEMPPLLSSGQVAGALTLLSGTLDPSPVLPLGSAVPIVGLLGSEVGPMDIDQVGADNNAVGYLAADYLRDCQVDELAYLTFLPNWSVSRTRFAGFSGAAKSTGSLPRAFMVSDSPMHAFEYGENSVVRLTPVDLVDAFVRGLTRRTGLFVSRDEELIHVHRWLTDRGVAVGKDVVLVSCDNDISRLSAMYPRPASVDLGASEIARSGLRRLLTRIAHPTERPLRILVRPTLQRPG